ncbi:adenosylcobinamide-GDP ribazoletransferase [Camelimonas fluminis]|uniref:Adenosylcobinamide-GDP ribazoletransferase n=1 Tax=Camelimonas fluminis TaxID=1576911 RepID=A0ABV7ULH8_9HYPH|nr:adenosylcobinamide-GDP ribazoletransferase [Camelimonas fluminis]GHE81317.1 adenosylcobinamide-GDP ribazoletransferase [Camelimonas fluminis]
MVRSILLELRDDFQVAAGFLTRIPAGAVDKPDIARCLRVFPAIGALIGVATGLVYLGLANAGVPLPAAGAIAFLASAMLTGALHEDGLADMADGLGGYTRERRLEIMRDSRIGTFGALALVFSAIARVTALAALPLPMAIPALAACGALGRMSPAAISRWTPQARRDGLASSAGRPELHVVVSATIAALVIAAVCLPKTWFVAAVGMAIVSALAVRWLAMRQLGGYTGDVLGCAEQVAEMALLLLFAAMAGAAA